MYASIRRLMQMYFTVCVVYMHYYLPQTICMKKLLDSDWLRAVQFKRNSAKKVTSVQKVKRQVQITHQ